MSAIMNAGFVLLPVVFTLLLVALLALVMNRESGINATTIGDKRELVQARLLAEAGLGHASWNANNSACSGYDLTTTSFGAHTYSASFSPASGSPVAVTATGNHASGISRNLIKTAMRVYETATTILLQPDAAEGKDNYIYEWKSGWNYGASGSLLVSNRFAFSMAHGFFQFDVSAIPSEAIIMNANLELRQNSPSVNGGTFGIRAVSSNWIEGTSNGGNGEANWNNRDTSVGWTTAGGDFSSTVAASVDLAASVVGWYSWDIAALVQQWVDGSAVNRGLVLTPEAVNSEAWFDSSDVTTAANRPKLTITWACECGAGEAGSTVLQPDGASGKDTFLSSFRNDASYGSDTVITVATSSDKHGLLEFDLSGLPAGAIVTSADLELYDETGSNSGSVMSVYRLTQDWLEGTTSAPSASTDGASWDKYNAITAWGTAGGDYDSTPVVQATMTGTAGTYNLDVTSVVSDWVGGTSTNNGFLLKAGSGFGSVNFTSSDSTNASERPKLTVNYTCPCGVSCTGTGTPLNILMVVGNDVSLSNDDTARKSLLESWGHTVILIDDGDSQANYDTAAAANDVAYTSETVDGAQLFEKLKNVSIGVVNEERLQYARLGFSSALGSISSMTDTDIIDNTHDITTGLALGDLSIVSSGQPLHNLQGTLSTDLVTLGAHPSSGYPMLAVLDTGDALAGGGNATGRRAWLPWGGDGFQFDKLNADGQTILRQALHWAAGSGTPTGPIAHWKLDETSGTTAFDSVGSNDGTLISTTAWVPGQLDGGLDFDGVNDYVDVGTMDVSGSGITMLGWFKADALPDSTDPRIISKASSIAEADAWWQLSILTSAGNRNIRLRVKAGGTTSTLIDSSTNLNTDAWYFAVGTYDEATGEMKLYLNGAEVASQSHPVGGAIDTSVAVPVAIGANGTAEQFFDGILDDVRLYDHALTATEIANLYTVGGGVIVTYTEASDLWWPSSADTWETVSLSSYGVPADAVVEIAVMNNSGNKENWVGVRAVGSSLERRFRLHEAEGGGNDVVVMHAQANGSSEIQTYADSNNIEFVLLGYWTGASYVEAFDDFSAGDDATWEEHDFSAYGVPASSVTEVVLTNDRADTEMRGGIRSSGGSVNRLINLQEAESGGIDAATMMVNTDSSAIAEIYAEENADLKFTLVGYWSTAPGTYTEIGAQHGQAGASSAWVPAGTSTFGIPANAVAQFIMSNEVDNSKRQLGMRSTGSSVDRIIDLKEAEDGGASVATLHVNVDSDQKVEVYSEAGTSDRYFYPIGWWVLTP